MNLTMILVVNKIDRLFDQGREVDEMEITYKIRDCIQDVNSHISSLCSGDAVKNNDEMEDYFNPLSDNVLFSSFKDKWAFR